MRDLECALLEAEYFPCIAWYELFIQFPNVVVEQYEYFVRASLRNRCYIAGPNGKLTLSVPLSGGRNQKTRMKDLKVDGRVDWQTQHWRTLQTCYNRSVYFEFYKDTFETFFAKKHTYLLDMNVGSIQLINQLLSIKKEIVLSEEYTEAENDGDYRSRFTAKNHASPSAKTYLQTFGSKTGFIKGLSIIDLLFCEGKNAIRYLRST